MREKNIRLSNGTQEKLKKRSQRDRTKQRKSDEGKERRPWAEKSKENSKTYGYWAHSRGGTYGDLQTRERYTMGTTNSREVDLN